MTDLDVHDPLGDLVHEALIADAQRAPHLPADWAGAEVSMLRPTDTRHPRRLVAICLVAAGVLLATLAVAARPGTDDNRPATTPPSWVPDGTEFPITDLGPATTASFGPTVAALTRQIGVDGHPPQIITTFLTYTGNATAVEHACTSEHGSSGCRGTAAWSISITSSVDNGYADYDLWIVDGLPADAAFVSYADGDQLLWQRPIMGVAAFPNVVGSNEVVIVYDTSGTETGRFDLERANALAEATPILPVADLSTQDFELLDSLTYAEMTRCLTDHRGTLNSNVATFPDDVDQLAVWTQCVIRVQEVVADAVNALNPRFYDPVTERPENPDSPFTYAEV